MEEVEIAKDSLEGLYLFLHWAGPIVAGLGSGLGGAWLTSRAQLKIQERESKRQDDERRRAQILGWRKMVQDINRGAEDRVHACKLLADRTEYLELSPHLTDEALKIIRGGMTDTVYLAAAKPSQPVLPSDCETLRTGFDYPDVEFVVRRVGQHVC